MNVVITQSMLFPWVGMLEQLRLADVLVHYDDVQFSKGSFTNRVQVKTAAGSRWMTVPLEGHRLGQSIDEVAIKPKPGWAPGHLDLLKQSLKGAPHAADALKLAASVYEAEHANIGQLARHSMLALAGYFGLLEDTRIIDVAELGIPGSSSQRVLEVVKAVSGSDYITGHGARHYLDHELFEAAGVRVRYMDYQCRPYPQMHGEFTPYVSGLDLVANCGTGGISRICSDAVDWRNFIDESN